MTRLKILQPLRNRDFALLWSGMTISLIGDGIYAVAIAWQVLQLSNRPSALSLVGAAWVTPQVLLLVFGGVLSDRIERRRMMIAADVIRLLAIGTLGVLSVTGSLRLWEVVVLVVCFAVGDSLFSPAFGAIVPELVSPEELVQANSLDNFVRPAARLLGPATGGLIVGSLGPGTAFLVDAGTFGCSTAALLLMRSRPQAALEAAGRSALGEIAAGFRFVRTTTWLWATIVMAAFGNIATAAIFVLVPYVVKNKLGGSAAQYGLIPAFGAVGGLIASVVVGQLGLPRRHIVLMYLSWGLGVLGIAGYGAATAIWQMLPISLANGACMTIGAVVWGTMMHTLVPSRLLGRVTAFDWTVSIGLTPVAFATLGPLAESIGASRTLIGCGTIAAAVHVAFLLVPGVRDTEHDERMAPTRPSVA